MDQSIATILFRQLFSRCTCRPLSRPLSFSSPKPACHRQRRGAGTSSKNKNDDSADGSMWDQKQDLIPVDKSTEFNQFPMTTSEELRMKKRRPKRMKMLLRDFIEDSLYNPGYGYFSKQAVIFDPGEPFDFKSMRNEEEFLKVLGKRYTAFEDKLDKKGYNESRQLWHTPTELFRPHYADALARYMVSNYKISNFPYHDLIIYELGAGNGTFMVNVLDYIRDTDPEVYARTKYKIIEISSSMASIQANRLESTVDARGHADKVEIINQSIFSWDTYVPSPCFVLALEVIDNFAHDVIRYSPQTEAPLQGTVLIDRDGDFYQFYNPILDPVASRFLRVRDAACNFAFTHPLRWSRLKRAVRASLPFAPNLSEPEFIPTRLMQFFDILQNFFPAHKLLLADFHSLQNSVPGINAPVVQTRFQRRTIPVTTPLVSQGYFDILFPTDFAVMEGIYRAITGKFTRVLTHEEFMRKWAFAEDTETKNGDNPLLSWYKNASCLVTI